MNELGTPQIVVGYSAADLTAKARLERSRINLLSTTPIVIDDRRATLVEFTQQISRYWRHGYAVQFAIKERLVVVEFLVEGPVKRREALDSMFSAYEPLADEIFKTIKFGP